MFISLLQIYIVVSFVIMTLVIITHRDEIEKEVDDSGDSTTIVQILEIACILLSPVLFTIILVWILVEAILNRTVRRKTIMANSNQFVNARLPKVIQRYNEYFT